MYHLFFYLFIVLFHGASFADEDKVITNQVLDVRVEQIRSEFYENEYQSLNSTVTVVFASLGIGFSILSFFGVRTIRQLKGQHKNELNELIKIRENVLTVDDLQPEYDDEPDAPDPVNANDELSIKLVNFLRKYSRWSFNPSRIHRWGSEQTGFNIFRSHNNDEIQKALEVLFEKGEIGRRVSSKGNFIYGGRLI